MIDTQSEPGAWQRALDRGCLEGRVHTSPSGGTLPAATSGDADGSCVADFIPPHPEAL